MARPSSDDPRVHTICLRLTLSEKQKLDEKRGPVSASDYLRRLLFGGKK